MYKCIVLYRGELFDVYDNTFQENEIDYVAERIEEAKRDYPVQLHTEVVIALIIE